MLHLLKLEWLKVKNYRTFWIFMALYVVGLFGINYIAYQFQLELEKKAPLRIFPYDFPKIWQTIPIPTHHHLNDKCDKRCSSRWFFVT